MIDRFIRNIVKYSVRFNKRVTTLKQHAYMRNPTLEYVHVSTTPVLQNTVKNLFTQSFRTTTDPKYYKNFHHVTLHEILFPPDISSQTINIMFESAERIGSIQLSTRTDKIYDFFWLSLSLFTRNYCT